MSKWTLDECINVGLFHSGLTLDKRIERKAVLDAELAELRKKAAALDWLEAHAEEGQWWKKAGVSYSKEQTLLDAIEAAKGES